GNLSGRIIGNKPESLHGVRLKVVSTERTLSEGLQRFGSEVISPDNEGRFEIPRLPAGELNFQAKHPDGVGFRLQMPAWGAIKSEVGKTTQADIPCKKAV